MKMRISFWFEKNLSIKSEWAQNFVFIYFKPHYSMELGAMKEKIEEKKL